jgi:hypothetical protein
MRGTNSPRGRIRRCNHPSFVVMQYGFPRSANVISPASHIHLDKILFRLPVSTLSSKNLHLPNIEHNHRLYQCSYYKLLVCHHYTILAMNPLGTRIGAVSPTDRQFNEDSRPRLSGLGWASNPLSARTITPFELKPNFTRFGESR